MFKEADYIKDNTGTSAALNLTFGDITEADMKTFISDQMSTQAGSFLAAFMNIDANNVFDSNDGLFDVLNDVLLWEMPLTSRKLASIFSALALMALIATSQLILILTVTQSVPTSTHFHLLSYRASLITSCKPNLPALQATFMHGLENQLIFEYIIQTELLNNVDSDLITK